jgi:hypothetical protein
LKGYFKDINNEIITIEITQSIIQTPMNIIQPLLGYHDKRKNVQVIREEQDARELHIERSEEPESSQKQQRTKKEKLKEKEEAKVTKENKEETQGREES